MPPQERKPAISQIHNTGQVQKIESVVSTKFEPQIDFEFISLHIEKTIEANALSVHCFAQPIFKNLGQVEPGTIFVREEEVTGQATGDFILQCVSPIDSSRPDLGHNPHEDPKDITIANARDMIGKDFYLDKGSVAKHRP